MSKKLIVILSVCVVLALSLTLVLSACSPQPSTPGQTTTITPQIPTQSTGTATITPSVPATTKPPTAPAAEVFNWKIQAAWVPGVAEYYTLEDYVKKIETASGGRLVITPYPGGALVPTDEHFDAVKTGIVQMIHSTAEYWPGMMPEAVMESGFPGTWKTIQDMQELFYGTSGTNLIDVLRPAYAEQNIYLVGVAGNINHTFWTKKPINSLADLVGIKMRAPGTTAKMLDKLGVATVFIPHEETYMALQLGTVDASATSGTMYEVAKYYEFCKYYAVPSIGAPGHWTVAANMDAWDSLPGDLQGLLQNMIKLQLWDARLANDLAETKMIAKAPAEWGTIIMTLPSEVVLAAAQAGNDLMQETMKANARTQQMGEIITAYDKSVGYLK